MREIEEVLAVGRGKIKPWRINNSFVQGDLNKSLVFQHEINTILQ